MGYEPISGRQSGIPAARTAGSLPSVAQSDWPCWRGASGDGRSTVTGIRKNWDGGLTELWSVDYLCQGDRSVTWGAPVIKGGCLVVPGRDETHDLVFCLDSESGQLLWVGKYEADCKSAHGPGARATPCIDGDRVYTFGRSGDLVCWSMTDGKKIWHRSVDEVGGEEPRWGHSSSPVVYGGHVIVQAGDETIAAAFDKVTGEPAWRSVAGDASYAAPALLSGPPSGLLIFHVEGLSCLDPDSGSRRWFVPWKTSYGVNASTPVVNGSHLFMTSGYKRGGQMLDISGARPVVLWENRHIEAQHSDPYIIDGHVYGYSGPSHSNRKGRLHCLDAESGEEKWSTSEVGWGTMVAVDGQLLCLSIAGDLFLVKPDPSRFVKVTEFRGALGGEVKTPAWTLPVVANDRLYLRYLQRLICYDLMPSEEP